MLLAIVDAPCWLWSLSAVPVQWLWPGPWHSHLHQGLSCYWSVFREHRLGSGLAVLRVGRETFPLKTRGTYFPIHKSDWDRIKENRKIGKDLYVQMYTHIYVCMCTYYTT